MKRIQFDFSSEQEKQIRELMQQTGASSIKELLQSALTLFLWAVSEKRAGRAIGTIDDSNHYFKELVMFQLEAET